ncbi:agmatinase [Thalassobaculum sp. OXR-137]|uniref:agmatinase n=1 Tax=Thalassobaculum sp. OXR-137 TaxID=3100173 RepID=UPI002AC8EF0A|nr:agmatinase [Thalassobaculum sp. OXR-137]WPZ36990.1 agmatinase [Thalassobaculum sp. OXR-137]
MPGDPRFQPVDAAVVPRFADVATFLRTKRHEVHPDVDIGLVGVPFDLGVNYRTGARQGPSGVREASRLIRKVHPTLGTKPFEVCNVADLGDAPVNPLDKVASIDLIQKFFEELRENGITPISIGGDHTIPTPILRGLVKDGPVGILQIDSHPDTLPELCGDTLNHATFMRLGIDEGWIDPKRVVQLGLRGSRFGDDIQYGLDQGFTVITIDDYEEIGRAETINRIHAALGDQPFYLTLDIDGVDPAYCPGTAVPEIGGLIPRDLQVIIRSLAGKPIIGADISEIAPCFDPTGITCVTAANLMFEMLCAIAEGGK